LHYGCLNMPLAVRRILLALLAVVWAPLAFAASSESFSNSALTARLISVENGVAPTAETLSLGLDIELADGWKAYWRSPGEVGLPPEVEWEGSQNLETAEILWPAPNRFTAFGIENFGYRDHVVLPISAVLDQAGAPTTLIARVTLLTCSDICVPHDFNLRLNIPAGTGIDAEAASLVTKFAQQIPDDPVASDMRVTSATLADEALVITARSDVAFRTPDVFPELGSQFSFGKPDIRVSASGKEVWAKLPLLARAEDIPPLRVTITDGARALTDEPDWSGTAATPPFEISEALPSFAQIMFIVGISFVGGLILNVMPCVLPVLSIKLASVIKHENRAAHVVRNGFLMSAFGVMAFMWVLAGGVLILQAAGVSVGWGLQFQSPLFLAIMVLVLVVFAANLLGLFEISLPSALQTRLASSSSGHGYAGDFATGAFAAVLATPCSAPFLGTAVAFALTGRPIDVLVVFSGLGLGLALPYLLFAARPGWVRHLPKPGRWMVAMKWGLGVLLALTAAWLLWVLVGVAGPLVAGVILVLGLVFVLFAMIPMPSSWVRMSSLAGVAALALVVPDALAQQAAPKVSAQDWVVFDRSEIPRLVSQGNTVFVDVTADWCLTCKANKALVLDRDPVAGQLQAADVVPMQADWTRPDPDISMFLETHNRFGIPFNIVYGPRAPEGIVLSELLTTQSVLEALEQAK
jgi:suppressor for copper-sensitivity B